MSSLPAWPEDGPAARAAVVATAQSINPHGLGVNKAGNVSLRCRRGDVDGALLTPTGLPYARLVADDLAFVPLAAPGRPRGRRAPSSEWRFHVDIYTRRDDVGAIVHTHSPAATALAVHGRGLPAFHYMVALAGGADIRCAPYATFGTQALSDHALAALADRKACLLAHHGAIACERTLERAFALALEVEHLAGIYLRALAIGEPPRLSDDEMARVVAKFATYGIADPLPTNGAMP
jgi:L-fuculose-phosphate aldolase